MALQDEELLAKERVLQNELGLGARQIGYEGERRRGPRQPSESEPSLFLRGEERLEQTSKNGKQHVARLLYELSKAVMQF